MRKKENNKRIKSFNLTEEQIRILEHQVAIGPHNSASSFIGWLIEAYDRLSDPYKELKYLEKEEDNLNEALKEIKIKRKKMLNHIEARKEREKIREEQIKEAINILKRKIIEGEEMVEIERIAKVHGYRLGIDAYELLYRAGKEVKQEQGQKNA